MWINNLSLPIHYHSGITTWWSYHVSLNTTISYSCGPLVHLAFVQMASNLAHKQGVHSLTCQMMFVPYAAPPILVWFFMKFMQELKFKVPAFCLSCPSTKIQFIIMHVKHMMVLWYTRYCDHKTTFGPT